MEHDLLDTGADMSAPRMLFGLRGRIPRSAYWRWGVGLPIGVALLLHLLLAIAGVPLQHADNVVAALLLWPMVAVSAKRWHDRDRSAWWVLVLLIPVFGWIWTLVDNGCVRGTRGRNRFGDDPLGDPDPATAPAIDPSAGRPINTVR